MRIVFFDTETTGNAKTDNLCQLAVKERGSPEPIINELFKPPMPIPIECSMIHHITNKKVADKPLFQESPRYEELKSLFEDEDTVIVAHNADFDAQMLKNDGISITNKLCTFKVIRELDGEGKFPMHKLQYLRYALDIELDVPAHDAMADVLVLEKVFEWELEQAKETWRLSEAETIKKMIEISARPFAFRHFDFGKHKGKTIAEVAATDKGYLTWLLEQKRQSPSDETDWIYTLEQYVK